MELEVLHVPDCPNLPPMLKRLSELTDLPITTRIIDNVPAPSIERLRDALAG